MTIRNLFLKTLGLTSLFFVVACSGISSEINSPYVEDPQGPKLNEKPRCSFQVKNNCWTRSIELITACIPAENVSDPMFFSDGLRKCENNSGKEVVFLSPLDLAGSDHMDDLEFEIFNGSRLCFGFKSQDGVFRLDKNPFGQVQVTHHENGDTHVSCLEGESFTITQEIKEKGCRGQTEKIQDYLPTASMQKIEQIRTEGFNFSFFGLGPAPLPIFRCLKE